MGRRPVFGGIKMALLAAWLIFAPSASPPAWAQVEKCPRPVARGAPLRLAALGGGDSSGTGGGLGVAQQAAAQVALTFLGHASFLIESPDGVTIVTDYNAYVRAPAPPRIATMNHAHDSHFTVAPEDGIAHVLRGWNPEGGPARHELTLADVWVRNVPTNLRGGGATEYDGNSMFVFEVAGLCIAHLGHLHHLLTRAHLEALGRIDVVLAPVDGAYTLDLDGMVETLNAIGAPLVIPMHYFSAHGLERFLARLGGSHAVIRAAGARVVVSRAALPKVPTVLVLPGR
ncbi:MBL fold metallo-hydrolase [Xanthobacter sp. V4C-4]|uniref:MBL fold metallo-hydrolase n=1 Tax=Xanthobacter cornucopiae TaxID=3119924 RepID=UPI0037271C37